MGSKQLTRTLLLFLSEGQKVLDFWGGIFVAIDISGAFIMDQTLSYSIYMPVLVSFYEYMSRAMLQPEVTPNHNDLSKHWLVSCLRRCVHNGSGGCRGGILLLQACHSRTSANGGPPSGCPEYFWEGKFHPYSQNPHQEAMPCLCSKFMFQGKLIHYT